MITNHPFRFTLTFRPSLQSLNQSCFLTKNTQYIEVTGENPHYFITLYPASEALFSFSLIESTLFRFGSYLDCLHTVTDGSSYPTLQPLTILYDIHPPTLCQVSSFSQTITPYVTLLLQASKKTNFLSNLKLVQIKEGQILRAFSAFDVMYGFMEWIIFSFILQIQLSGNESMNIHIPTEAISDEAGNEMETDFELKLNLRWNLEFHN